MGTFVGPVVSSFLMQRTSPWVPLMLTAAIALLGLGVIAFIPKTLVLNKKGDDKQEEESTLVNTNDSISSTIKIHLCSSLSRLLVSFLRNAEEACGLCGLARLHL
ncbi:hypothetical protein B0T26DRAFT_695474 [Lasiosphaeria miniovina]|uniref:Uncharacterized protein n=1 Tax=Lasiosphaeria miniovina TaxID=1954250 RepID=A0AA40E9V7_9PEZI|nr:uncharacterized protein B0T26DRAFT_695474 [Lasiosphaeria miniovina]KAK0727713.1 hypothetical protein B0T26DRAFT_695474 [Lasiosphaeria miniovina]